MNELIRPITQADVCAMQDFIGSKPQVEPEMEHIFAFGVYMRVMKTPADTYVVGKAHKTKHICVLLKGTLTVTMDDGTMETMTAPHIWVAPAGKKKMLYMVTYTEMANIHPTDTEDLDEIESRVIEPEPEFRARLGINAAPLLEE